jgi:hypothetical protein
MGEERDTKPEPRPEDVEVEAQEPSDLEVEDEEGDAVQGGTLRRSGGDNPVES